jgi:5-methylcytosine-specific restriction endonuclease McrA
MNVMPIAAPRRCPVPGHEPFRGRRCPRCEKEYDKTRPPPSQRGYGRQWQSFRLAFLRSNPTCVRCGSKAEQVDHITPIRSGGALVDPANVQAMCSRCHSQKTRRQNKNVAPTIY